MREGVYGRVGVQVCRCAGVRVCECMDVRMCGWGTSCNTPDSKIYPIL